MYRVAVVSSARIPLVTPYTGLHVPEGRLTNSVEAVLGIQFLPTIAGEHRPEPACRARHLRGDADRRRQVALLPVARRNLGQDGGRRFSSDRTHAGSGRAVGADGTSC